MVYFYDDVDSRENRMISEMIFAAALLYGLPDSSFALPAIKAPSPPAIDGTLRESEWGNAPIASRFIQYEPHRGETSSVQVEGLCMYDAKNLYVAFRIRDPRRPLAQLTRRDADLLTDDAVIVILDSFNDKRTAYYFMTNAIGTQADGRIADDGRTVDGTWDAPWQSAAEQSDSGWTAELSIPLSSLNYSASAKPQTWGLNLGISVRRNFELSFWAGPLEQRFRVSQAGSLTNLILAPSRDRLQVIPYGLNRFQEHASPTWNAGIDIRYALSSQLASFGTVNPDFATIEADQEQVNLTRFELSLKEKRPYFLEGNELFQQRITLFYSRRIPEIAAAAKLLGKTGPVSLALLGVRSKSTFDGSAATFSVGRARCDVLEASNIGFTLADRELAGQHQGSAGIDATLFFTKTLGMTAQVVRSYGKFGKGSWAYFLRPAFDSPTSHFHVRYTNLGEYFGDNANVTGLIRDDNRKEVDAAYEQSFWLQGRILERVDYGSNYNVYWSQTGILKSWQIDESVEFQLRNLLSVELAHTEEFKRFEADFRNRQTSVDIGYNTREYQSTSIGFEFGKNFGSDFRLWTARSRYKLTPELSVEYQLQRLTLSPDPENGSTWIHVLSANQFFTKDLYLRVFSQTNSSIDRVNIQAVFVYRYKPPFGSIQIAYQRGNAAFGQRSVQGNTLFLKLTTVL